MNPAAKTAGAITIGGAIMVCVVWSVRQFAEIEIPAEVAAAGAYIIGTLLEKRRAPEAKT